MIIVDAAMLDYIAFLSCLEFAVLNSVYHDIILRPKQVICLEGIFLQNDVLCVLPTGYGKTRQRYVPFLEVGKKNFTRCN